MGHRPSLGTEVLAAFLLASLALPCFYGACSESCRPSVALLRVRQNNHYPVFVCVILALARGPQGHPLSIARSSLQASRDSTTACSPRCRALLRCSKPCRGCGLSDALTPGNYPRCSRKTPGQNTEKLRISGVT